MIQSCAVAEVFGKCLYSPKELRVSQQVPPDAVVVRGLTASFGFHPQRLVSYKDQVALWLACLPDEFRSDGGGGWSFLNMVQTKDGTLWGNQRSAQELLVLGLGLGLIKYCLPADMWPVLPGGVPYLVVCAEGVPRRTI